jgi:hypothetical protein
VILLLLARSSGGWYKAGNPETFQGRRLGERVDLWLVQNWLQLCASKHGDVCTKSIQNQAILANIRFRMVDVEQKCIVNAIPGSKWAALSYVWGTAERLLFCVENSDRFQTPGGLGDTFSDIPQTFLDAMDVVESLGFRYLWIDALCI